MLLALQLDNQEHRKELVKFYIHVIISWDYIFQKGLTKKKLIYRLFPTFNRINYPKCLVQFNGRIQSEEGGKKSMIYILPTQCLLILKPKPY